ncbi:MAG: polyhydroxyalkanoate synthesis repressor PhaR [Hyphomicrobiaceae bacterium]
MADQRDRSDEAVVIKKYANRRLYNTETSSYVTLEDLAQMVRADRDFVVCDAKSGDDLTHSVLTQIIVEQEGKAGGPTLLPIPFLRQLIRYYDDAVGKMVPSYLQYSMSALAKEQERYRTQFTNWGPNAFEAYQEQARKNLALFEQAMSMWSPLSQGGGAPQPGANGDAADPTPNGLGEPSAEPGDETQADAEAATSEPEAAPKAVSEIDLLKAELAAMQVKIERISRS